MAWEIFDPAEPGNKAPAAKPELKLQPHNPFRRHNKSKVLGIIPNSQKAEFLKDVAELRRDRKRST